MKADEFCRLLDRIEFSYPLSPWAPRLSASHDACDYALLVRFTFEKALERDTGKPGPVTVTASVALQSIEMMNEAEVLEWIRMRLLKPAVLHELDESIKLNGLRPFDPHELRT